MPCWSRLPFLRHRPMTVGPLCIHSLPHLNAVLAYLNSFLLGCHSPRLSLSSFISRLSLTEASLPVTVHVLMVNTSGYLIYTRSWLSHYFSSFSGDRVSVFIFLGDVFTFCFSLVSDRVTWFFFFGILKENAGIISMFDVDKRSCTPSLVWGACRHPTDSLVMCSLASRVRRYLRYCSTSSGLAVMAILGFQLLGSESLPGIRSCYLQDRSRGRSLRATRPYW